MRIVISQNGCFALPDIVDDFKNSKARREYKKELQKVKKELARMNKSSMWKRALFESNEKPEKCPTCGSRKVIGWGTFSRKVRQFFSKIVRAITTQRYRCKRCKRTFSKPHRWVTKNRRFSDKALRDMVDAKLWFYAGYRKVGKWCRIHGSSAMTVLREIIRLAPMCREALRTIKCKFSGIVCVDEVYFRRVKGDSYMGLTAVDARYGRVILEGTYYAKNQKCAIHFDDLWADNVAASKTECIRQFLSELISVANPKVIITDDYACYGAVIDEINKEREKENRIKHYLCTFHLKWNINKAFRGHGRIKLADRFAAMREELLAIFDADTLEEANILLNKALEKKQEFIGTSVEKVFKKLEENKERLFPYLKYGMPRTNNPVEFYFSFLKRFQHVSRKFPTLLGVRCLLSVFALFFNFMPKMERDNKGKTPLQMAGWNHKFDMYTFIGYPKFAPPLQEACLNISCH